MAITRDILYGNLGGALVTAGSSGDVISTNEIIGEINPIDVEGSANTVIASNTISAGTRTDGLIGVSADSTGTSIENNVLDVSNLPTTGGSEISVDSTSTAGTTEDYNVLSPESEPQYHSWAGVAYPSQSAFAAATGQSEHDLLADTQLNPPPYTDVVDAPQTNSANSAAPGMLSTDLYGYSCTGEPVEPVTGAGSPAYCARRDAAAVHDDGRYRGDGVGGAERQPEQHHVADVRGRIRPDHHPIGADPGCLVRRQLG